MRMPVSEAACLALDVSELCTLRTAVDAARAGWVVLCTLIGAMEGSDRLMRVAMPVMREWDDLHCAWNNSLVAVDYQGWVHGV